MEGKDWVELLKFPLTIMVGIATIVVGSLILKVKPTDFEIGELKVKLETELKKELFTSSIDFGEEIRKEVKNQLRNLKIDTSSYSDSLSTKPANDIVSDEIAKLATVETSSGTKSVFESTIGYIWIGNYYPKNDTYSKIKINVDNLKDVQIGQTYFVNGNMVIREFSPINNINYYQGIKKIGVVIKGEKVRIMETPQIKDLSNYQQFWVKIKVLN